MKFIRTVIGAAILVVSGILISAMFLPPSKDIVFRAEMATLDGVPFDLNSIVEFHQLSLTTEEKTCLNKQVDFYDNIFVYMSKGGVNNLLETKRRAFEAGYSYPEYRRRLIAGIAADKCSGLGRERKTASATK